MIFLNEDKAGKKKKKKFFHYGKRRNVWDSWDKWNNYGWLCKRLHESYAEHKARHFFYVRSLFPILV